MTTLDYYNNNFESFTNSTKDVVFTDTQDKFLSYLSESAYILDFGCGSGRDSKYFLSKGYKVDACDGSIKLCEIASELTGLEVKNILFTDLEDKSVYSGIWACSSILHCPKNELITVLNKMSDALVDNGIIYTSFKYSEFAGERNGRYFTDFTESSFTEFIKSVPSLTIVEYWITGDVRPGRSNEKWLNLILRKVK